MKKPAPKTEDEIKAEIAALKACKSKVRQRNYFGDSLHDAIDAQVVVLDSGLDEGEIYDRFQDPDDEENCNDLDAALDALAWMNGEERDDIDHESLAPGWLAIGLG